MHVGINDIDRAVRICDRLRPVLPLLLAVSANSPYLDGRDSGLHSARTQSFTRNFPRCGIPDAFGGWGPYRQYIEFLLRTNSIVEFTQVWWSVRPHFEFGTVEVRICDAQSTAGESEALAALIVACVAQAARDLDEGVPFADPPPRLIEENMWRAIRFGLDGRMVDLERAEEYPATEIVERLAAWTEPVRAELGVELAFPERNGAQRQRAMIEAGASREEVFATSVARDKTDLFPGGDGVSSEQQPQPSARDVQGPGEPTSQAQPSEDELRAAYEAELNRISSAEMIIQTTVSLINIAGRRLGLATARG